MAALARPNNMQARKSLAEKNQVVLGRCVFCRMRYLVRTFTIPVK